MSHPRPEKAGAGSLAILGISTAGAGGCLVWTIILIPVAVPMILIGIIMTIIAVIWGLFIKSEPLVCPVCGGASQVELKVTVTPCEHCKTVLKRETDGWIPVKA